jgi:hypothetical protein
VELKDTRGMSPRLGISDSSSHLDWFPHRQQLVLFPADLGSDSRCLQELKERLPSERFRTLNIVKDCDVRRRDAGPLHAFWSYTYWLKIVA